jgi:hypothetical protein
MNGWRTFLLRHERRWRVSRVNPRLRRLVLTVHDFNMPKWSISVTDVTKQCVCHQGDQTVDHLLYDCILLETQRRILRKNVTKNGQWPVNKHELITKHLEPLIAYIESIDFDIL